MRRFTVPHLHLWHWGLLPSSITLVEKLCTHLVYSRCETNVAVEPVQHGLRISSAYICIKKHALYIQLVRKQIHVYLLSLFQVTVAPTLLSQKNLQRGHQVLLKCLRCYTNSRAFYDQVGIENWSLSGVCYDPLPHITHITPSLETGAWKCLIKPVYVYSVHVCGCVWV